MKAIVEIDMPKSCEDCPLLAMHMAYAGAHPEVWCVLHPYKDATKTERPAFCPLKIKEGGEE